MCLAVLVGRAWAGGDAADEAMSTIHPEAIRADMRFLADDLLEGRGTGARGYDIAAAFVATRFEALGLEPAGDQGSYFQKVPLRSMRVDQSESSFVVVRGGKERTLQLRQDALVGGNPGVADSIVDAPVVFVGYGVTAPESGYDDYKHVDVKGKIVAFLFGAPNFDASLKAHYSSSVEKRRMAVEHGAAGLILLDDPRTGNHVRLRQAGARSRHPRIPLDRSRRAAQPLFSAIKGHGLFEHGGDGAILRG